MFSNTDVAIANEVLRWARESLAAPTEKMRRTHAGPPEAVCPFVKPSLESGSFYIEVHHEINGQRPEPIVDLMRKYTETFRGLPPFEAGEQQKKALLAVFPEIPAHDMPVLDLVHDQIKTCYMQKGFMVTQCYPGCDMRSKRNPELRVYDSPWPLMALRLMAIHDILFVEDNEDWFAAFNARFGQKFRDPKTLKDHEQPLLEEYIKARTRFIR